MSAGSYGTSFVASIGPEATLRAAAQTLEKCGVGLLVVEKEGKLLGVVTDRDLALAVVAGRHCPASSRVRDVMSRPSARVDADAPLRRAIEAMHHGGVRRVPLMNRNGRVQGVLAADDVVRLIAGELAGLAGVAAAQSQAIPGDDLRGGSVSSARAAEHYLKPVLCARQDASAAQTCNEMKSQAVGSAVVVDEDSRAVGIVTDRDLVLRVVAAGLDPETTPIAAVMSRPVACVEADAPIEDVIETMRAHAVRRMPVLRNGKPVGIVTYDDLVLRLGEELQALGGTFARRQRSERVTAPFERARDEVADRLGELAAQLAQRGDQALARIGREIESLRERLHRTRS
jgi:CBS domain-containing protein